MTTPLQRKLVAVLVGIILCFGLYKVMFSDKFLAVPEPYRLSPEERTKYYQYLEAYDHPPVEDVKIPTPEEAAAIAYGG